MTKKKMRKHKIILSGVLICVILLMGACSADTGIQENKESIVTQQENTKSELTDSDLGHEIIISGKDKDNKSSDKEDVNENLSAYFFRFLDDKGNPVEGVKLQICTEDTCQLLSGNSDGFVEYSADRSEYEVHVFRIPEGYELLSDETFKTGTEYSIYDILFKASK